MKREVVARIRLDALRHNLRIVRQRCPHSRVVAMVKANAYGHGLLPVAKALADADMLGVAVIEEAMALRAGGISKPVVIMEGVFSAQELRIAADENFGVVVHQPEQVALVAHTALSRPLDVWLKLETGMHRLGLPVAAAAAAVEGLRARARHVYAMTHFACADEPQNPMTRLQLEQLQAFARANQLPASAANSGAIVSAATTHLDAVRPGIMLYGGAPVAGKAAFEFGLQPAMTLAARVIAINEVPQGDSVGYSATWHAPRDSRIAVLGVGYGDGYPRHAMQGTPVRIGKHLVPMVGRVSMDMITVDVTAHPDISLGDEAVLWGEDLPADTVARHASTISYELFCRLTSRVRFEYVH
jgi:alanine racemase